MDLDLSDCLLFLLCWLCCISNTFTTLVLVSNFSFVSLCLFFFAVFESSEYVIKVGLDRRLSEWTFPCDIAMAAAGIPFLDTASGS
jgi:hypothetical protein